MKKIILILMLIIFISGCAEEGATNPKCQEYCEQQIHIMCVGHWEISGEYPDCNCRFVCDVKEVS